VTAVVPPATSRRRATGTFRPPVRTGVRRVGTGLARTLLSLRVEGAEHVPTAGPVILAGNHSGILDGPLVYFVSPRPCRLLTKAEVFVGPWARPCGWLGLIPVHRGQADRAALQAGLAELAAGGALGVFPEGTRGTGALEQVADGVAYLALRSGAPVVPIAVTGTRAALPRGKVVPVLRTPVRVVFGAPVTVEPTGDPRARRTVRDAAEQLRLALVAHLESTSRTTPSSAEELA
jgi:1-acyl-sn-glycerol-3-phosphate acyltransferase